MVARIRPVTSFSLSAARKDSFSFSTLYTLKVRSPDSQIAIWEGSYDGKHEVFKNCRTRFTVGVDILSSVFWLMELC
jgi:hypothetical protein